MKNNDRNDIIHEFLTITSMKDQGNTMINTENMKVDVHALMLIKNRLHH